MNGSMYQGGTSAKNIITQPTPSGTWTVTAKVDAHADRELPPGRPARVVRRRQLGVGAHDLGGRQPPVRVHLRGRGQPAQRRGRQQRRAPDHVADDLLRADPLGRHEPDGVLLLRRRDVPARRPAGAAEHVRQPADRADGAQRLGSDACRSPRSTGSGSTRTPATAPAAVAAPVAARSSRSSTGPTSRPRRGRSCAATRA